MKIYKSTLKKQYNAVLNQVNHLSSSLQLLGLMASDILGYEVNAELCGGNEIEFRRLDEYGMSDENSTIRIEDILGKEDKL